jgi:hypothetical protein
MSNDTPRIPLDTISENGVVFGSWDEHRSCWVPEYGKQDELAARLGDGWAWDDYYGSFFANPGTETPKDGGLVEATGWRYCDASGALMADAAPPCVANEVTIADTLASGALRDIADRLASAFRARKSALQEWDERWETGSPAPVNAVVSHESEPSVPDADECSSPSERATCLCCNSRFPFRDEGEDCSSCDRLKRDIRRAISFHLLSGASVDADYLSAFIRDIAADIERKINAG